MIERVARAMFRRRITDLHIYDRFPGRLDDAVERGWEFCAVEAQAAIEAMREPTEAMVRVLSPPLSPESARTHWRACIDEALSGEPL